MTAPIDIDCPACKSTPGNYCTDLTDPCARAEERLRLAFHHAARIDAAVHESDRRTHHDPKRLREALREALNMLHAYVEGCNDARDRQRVADLRKEFALENPVRHEHTPQIEIESMRIIGCTCGWRIPSYAANSDDALALHVAIARTAARP